MKLYVTNVRTDAPAANNLFLNSREHVLDHLSRDLSVHYQTVTGSAKHITSTGTRHATVTSVSQIVVYNMFTLSLEKISATNFKLLLKITIFMNYVGRICTLSHP